jgi:glycosyltransferase involved in cell wall biosynthesis
MKRKIVSIVVPCYNEEETVPLFYREITSIAKEIDESDFEFIFIDDGSTDKTLRIILDLNEKDDRVKYVSFSRNFGKEAAIYAGFKKAKGDYIALIDADLQDPPILLKEMYNLVINEDYDCVAARRIDRKGESKIRTFFARLFYKLMKRISDTNIVDGARDFRLMTRQMVNAILELSEYNRFSKGILVWVGFNTKWLDYENIQRVGGTTKWSMRHLFAYSLDGIFAFSTAPLVISSFLGTVFCLISFIMICIIVLRTLIWGDPVAGFPALICAIFLLGGIQLFCIGILGQYLSKTYLETKKRPIYIIKKESI